MGNVVIFLLHLLFAALPLHFREGGGQSTLMEFRGLMARSQTIGKRVGVHQQQQQKKKKKTRNNANVMSRREADVPG